MAVPTLPIITTGQSSMPLGDGVTWHIKTVDESDLSCVSLDVDSSGHPHITYYKRQGPEFHGDLKYAAWDGTDWQIETVDSGEYTTGYACLALDGSGRAHISYSTQHLSPSLLKYATQNRSGWQIDIVDGPFASGLPVWSSLSLDSWGHPYISYSYAGTGYGGADTGDYPLKYATWDGFSWHIETVENSDVGYSSSLALDSSGHPHITYSREGLQYAYGQPHLVTITVGPSGDPNPVISAGQVQCTVTAQDSLGHTLSYQWSAEAGTFDDSTKQNPIWTAPENTTDSVVPAVKANQQQPLTLSRLIR